MHKYIRKFIQLLLIVIILVFSLLTLFYNIFYGHNFVSFLIIAFYAIILFFFITQVFFKDWEKKRYYKAWLIVLSIILSLILGEAVIRIGGSQEIYSESRAVGFLNKRYYSPFAEVRHRKWSYGLDVDGWHGTGQVWLRAKNEKHTFETPEFNYSVSTNSLGLVNPEIGEKRSPRIIALGDSFTEGVGAPADSSWPVQLANIFQKDNINIEVINAGIIGSDLGFCYKLLQNILHSKLQPDLAIFCINATDINDCVYRGGLERFHEDGTLHFVDPPWWEIPGRISHLFRGICSLFGARIEEYGTEPEQQKAAGNKLLEIIKATDDYCKKVNLKACFIFHPLKMELTDRQYDDVFKQVVIKSLEQLQNPVIDLKILLEQTSYSSDDLYWNYDQHYNSLGYQQVARLIYPRIKEQVISNQKQ